MEDIGLQWNPKKCNVLNVRRGVPVDIPEGFKSGETLINRKILPTGSSEHSL